MKSRVGEKILDKMGPRIGLSSQQNLHFTMVLQLTYRGLTHLFPSVADYSQVRKARIPTKHFR